MYAGKKRKRDESQSNSEGYDTEEMMIKEYGFGKSLFKDDEDEHYINSLKGLEREKILSERHEKCQMMKEKIKLLREYNIQNKSQRKEGKISALSDIRERREKRFIKDASESEKSESSSGQDSSSEDDNKSEESYSSRDRSEDDDSQVSKKRGINFMDLEKIRVSRSDLEKWYDELHFEDTILGTFVRINIGEFGDKNGSNQYKIYEIIGTKTVSPSYLFGNKMADKEIVVKYGRSKKNFKMIVVSNSKFTPTEFSQWRTDCEKHNEPIPTNDVIEAIEAKLKKTRNYSYTPNEINKIIEQNINQLIEKGVSNMNVTYIRTQLETQFKLAKRVQQENPSEEALEIYNRLKLNLDKLNEIQRKKVEEKSGSNPVQNINDRARKLQIEEDRRRSEMIKHRSKVTTEFDPFSTLQCRPQILWNTNNVANKNDATKTPDTTKVQEKKLQDEKMILQKHEFKTDFEKSVLRKERILNTMKSMEINSSFIGLDSNDFSKFPKFNKMPKLVELNPILQSKLENEYKQKIMTENRRVYSLEEYCSKFMN